MGGGGAVADLLTLTAWAQVRYGAAAPSLATLRRWARDGLIYPAPTKHGRAYFVRPDAQYLDAETRRHGTTETISLAAKLAGSSART
jgi:predicted site-specific integrase-resolvase